MTKFIAVEKLQGLADFCVLRKAEWDEMGMYTGGEAYGTLAERLRELMSQAVAVDSPNYDETKWKLVAVEPTDTECKEVGRALADYGLGIINRSAIHMIVRNAMINAVPTTDKEQG